MKKSWVEKCCLKKYPTMATTRVFHCQGVQHPDLPGSVLIFSTAKSRILGNHRSQVSQSGWSPFYYCLFYGDSKGWEGHCFPLVNNRTGRPLLIHSIKSQALWGTSLMIPVAKTLCSQYGPGRGVGRPRFNPQLGNYIPLAATKRTHIPQWRWKSLCASAESQHSQIKINLKSHTESDFCKNMAPEKKNIGLPWWSSS